jgi:glycosyltransferase involved in cell wall biosynthesis
VKLAIVTIHVLREDGQARVNYEIARHALQHGASVWLLADRVEPEIEAMGARWIPVRPRRRRPNLLKHREFVPLADRALDRLARDVNLDIVHGNGFSLTRPHHVNTAHFVHSAWRKSPVHIARLRRDLNALYQWTYSTLNARWERLAYERARVVVAVSERVRRDLGEAGVAPERIRVIENGVDPDEFYPGQADRSRLGLPESVPLAFFAGGIRTPLKNLDSVLRALVSVPTLHVAVAGATEGSPYPALAARLGVAGRVHFLGYRRDVPELLRAADLLVFPSRYESFALIVLEAMASGLPVITASTVGAADLVSPDCGIVLPDPNDVAGLAGAMAALVDHPERRASLGRSARAVAERHSWSEMAETYMRLYQEMMQRPSVPVGGAAW